MIRRMGSRAASAAIAIGAVMLTTAIAAQTPRHSTQKSPNAQSQPASAASAVSALIVTTQTPPPAQTTTEKSPYPPGPGRDALFKICNDCHGPESVLGQLKTRDEWSKTLDEMAANGAQGTDEEWNRLLDYLDQYYSLILVNTAPAKELALKLDVTADVADAIVRTRTDKGKFASLDDLKRVPGVDSAKIDARKDRLIF
jgi:competence protein ComEA